MLVACCLMMAGCTVESMIRGYHKYTYEQTIGKLLFESELDLLKYCNPYPNPYVKQIKVYLTLLCTLHVTKTGNLLKLGELEVICKIK